jgi:hypothetical protein
LPQQSPTLPRGLEGGNPFRVKIFVEKSHPSKRLSRLPAISVTGPQETNKSACKWQGRPSRGTPTPLGYGYLTRRLPRKITLTWVSNPTTDERVQIRKTGGKEKQPYITMIKCSGPNNHNEQTPALKVPLQTELRFHSRRYEQPPTLEGLQGDKTPGGSPTPAPAAATTTSAPSAQIAAAMTSGRTLLRRAPRPRPHSRGEDKLSKPEARSADGGGDLVGNEDFFSRHHLNVDNDSHLPTGRCPLGSSRTGEAPTSAQEASYRSKGRTAQEHERRPSSARRLGRPSGARGAATTRTAGGDTGSRARAS